jgi:phosphate transport system permease protein
MVRDWIASGSPWVWLTAGAVSVCLVMVIGLIGLIGVRSLSQFWPVPVERLHLTAGEGSPAVLIGERIDEETVDGARLRQSGYPVPAGLRSGRRFLFKIGNREITGLDFHWVPEVAIRVAERPPGVVVVEREEWGNLYGFLEGVEEAGRTVVTGEEAWEALRSRLERRHELKKEIRHIEKEVVGGINFAMEGLRLRERELELRGELTAEAKRAIEDERARLQAQYKGLGTRLGSLYEEIRRDAAQVAIAGGRQVRVPLAAMVRVHRPNSMSAVEKFGHYFEKLWAFIADEPREANTEGGIFPAIFGTVLMVIIMSVFVTPFGVVAAVYLREYARQGPLTRTIRIAVNNLAGVPSVVYGVFGLGFFVYFIGGRIDSLFYREALPAPTFGTPGLLWSSVTLAVLTVPVVIVATEEGLTRIPRAIREGSLALGATRAETLWRTVLPMATPAMMTGLILAVARAAGEVAPLMMVGVVKLAPSLPLDGNFPYLHLERKFMHLGFHIYDVGFQSPNVEAARPLVYSTAFLLVIIIVALNLAAIRIRNRLRERYSTAEA